MTDQQQAASVKRYAYESFPGCSYGPLHPDKKGRFVEYADYSAAIAGRDAAQSLAKAFADESLLALAGAKIPTPERGYIKGFPQGGGPGQLGSDIRRLAEERDAAQRECERLKHLSLAKLADWQNERNQLRADLDKANDSIRKMGEAADKERRELVAEVERLRTIKRVAFEFDDRSLVDIADLEARGFDPIYTQIAFRDRDGNEKILCVPKTAALKGT